MKMRKRKLTKVSSAAVNAAHSARDMSQFAGTAAKKAKIWGSLDPKKLLKRGTRVRKVAAAEVRRIRNAQKKNGVGKQARSWMKEKTTPV